MQNVPQSSHKFHVALAKSPSFARGPFQSFKAQLWTPNLNTMTTSIYWPYLLMTNATASSGVIWSKSQFEATEVSLSAQDPGLSPGEGRLVIPNRKSYLKGVWLLWKSKMNFIIAQDRTSLIELTSCCQNKTSVSLWPCPQTLARCWSNLTTFPGVSYLQNVCILVSLCLVVMSSKLKIQAFQVKVQLYIKPFRSFRVRS